ncbi:MAG: hypothetical protein ACNA7H_04430, partial [Desulfotignum sp.]
MRGLFIIPLLVFTVFSTHTPFAGPPSPNDTRALDTIVVTPGPWRIMDSPVPSASARISVIGSEAIVSEQPVSIT